jgi:hypothetical protein
MGVSPLSFVAIVSLCLVELLPQREKNQASSVALPLRESSRMQKYKNKAEWQNDTPVFVPGGRKKFEARPPSTQILRP